MLSLQRLLQGSLEPGSSTDLPTTEAKDPRFDQTWGHFDLAAVRACAPSRCVSLMRPAEKTRQAPRRPAWNGISLDR